MQISNSLKCLALAAAIQLVGVSGAWAQNSPAERTNAAADISGVDTISLMDEDIKSLSNKEKLSRGADKIEQMRATLAQTNQLLETVRNKDGDIIKVNCVNEKLASMKGFVKVGEQSYTSLNAAVSAGDDGAANHHYTLISVAREKVRTLAGEAGLCTGEEMRFSGSAQVDVTTPDTGNGEFDVPEDVILVTDLPELTPYQ
jgi:hypothetical protein